jgi:ATP phosphoribosyltransferase regulatory subunit
MNKQIKFLHTPPGSKPFYKEEALFRNKIEKTLSNYFEKWNFFPIETPIIDYFDVYSPILSDEMKRGSMRFIDRDGELILLRNDITLFAAKLVASRATENNNTMKFYYSDAIIRCEKSGAPEEYHQIGCEIVGNNYAIQEIEILCILFESLKLLEVKNYMFHIGDISFYQSLFSDISKEDLFNILKSIRLRDKKQLYTMLSNLNVDQEIKNDCLLASTFIGTLKELENLSFSKKGKKAITHLTEIGKILTSLNYIENVNYDLSELSNLSYYNGIIFHVYARGSETPLVSGGRYDLLFKELGLEKAAVGFIYWLYPLEKLLNNSAYLKADSSENVKISKTPAEDFKKAINLISQNKKINLDY